MAHILVVGGTGMLYDVCLHFCNNANTVTVIARNQKRLNRLDLNAEGMAGSINPISLDYADYEHLKNELRKSITIHGSVELAVCWIHTSIASEAATIIADIINKQNDQTKCKYYQLFSSATADPSLEKKDISNDFKSFYNIEFRTIVLGFIVEAKTSRWLTDNEISEGVIAAVANDNKESIIGTVEPWEKRP